MIAEPFWHPDNLRAAATVLILIAAVYGFVSERFPPDVVALLALLALLIIGVLSPVEAFSGFSHPATVSIAAVLVLSAGVQRTGVLSFLARRVLAPMGRSEWLLTLTLMLSIAALSAFVNNTAAVAIFIPIVMEVCRRTNVSPGRVLMPMSHAATFGGMCTLVGTSTNLVAHEYAISQGLPGFSMFGLARIGLPMLVIGTLYILLIGRRFLPGNNARDTPLALTTDSYLGEVIVLANSAWIGREIKLSNFERDHALELIGVVRDGQIINLDRPFPRYAEGDKLWVRGELEHLLALVSEEGLELDRPTSDESRTVRTVPDSAGGFSELDPEGEAADLSMAEVVVLTTSGLIGQTLKEVRFVERFDAVVLALRRRDAYGGSVSETRLHAGDVLVVEGKNDAILNLSTTRGFLVIGAPAYPEKRPRKLIIAVVTLLAVIVVVSLGILPIVTAATAGCALLIVTGCLKPREAYGAIDLSIVFVLAGSLALGLALEKTGITMLVAHGLSSLTTVTGPFLVLVVFFVIAVILSELMSNGGTVALLGPIAFSTAAQMEINPMSLLVAVTFGASAAFAMPIGYQTSLMIYGPGGYRARDFVKMGLVLDVLLGVIALVLIPYFWPLTK